MLVSPLRIFATLAVAGVVGVSAQDACIIGCLTQSLSPSTCTSYTNITCVCSNTAFQSAASACLQANCTASDQADALELQQSQCGSGSSTSGSSSTSTSPAPASSSTSSASTPTPSNGAVHEQVPFFKSAIALAAVALGGAFIL